MKKILISIAIILSISGYSQTNLNQKLSVFIDGWIVDFNYVRNNVKFVDFVNDAKTADVHVIVSHNSTGGGGSEYKFAFYAKNIGQMGDIILSCNTYSFESVVVIREKLASTLKAGLLPYLNEKNGPSAITVTYNSSSESENNALDQQPETVDKWNNWVFRMGLSGGISGEEQKSDMNYSLNLDANKITDQWKIKSNYDLYRKESRITSIEDGVEKVINSTTLHKDLGVSFVYSLSAHWSTGIFFNGTQSTYRNNKMKMELIPALQYNFLQWAEVDRRSFTITYKIGPSYNSYYETTIFGKDKEWLWNENIEIRFEKKETWGDIEMWLEGGHFFPDFEKYFYQAGLDLSFRVSKGLSFTLRLQAENVQNQIYLPKSELSLEDLLLNIRKPPTSFEYSSRVGIRFQFGSLYNNIVNERLD